MGMGPQSEVRAFPSEVTSRCGRLGLSLKCSAPVAAEH